MSMTKTEMLGYLDAKLSAGDGVVESENYTISLSDMLERAPTIEETVEALKIWRQSPDDQFEEEKFSEFIRTIETITVVYRQESLNYALLPDNEIAYVGPTIASATPVETAPKKLELHSLASILQKNTNAVQVADDEDDDDGDGTVLNIFDTDEEAVDRDRASLEDDDEDGETYGDSEEYVQIQVNLLVEKNVPFYGITTKLQDRLDDIFDDAVLEITNLDLRPKLSEDKHCQFVATITISSDSISGITAGELVKLKRSFAGLIEFEPVDEDDDNEDTDADDA